MISTVYVLDANVFIQAERQYYPFDLVPAFWKCLVEYAEAGHIRSVDRVKEELERVKDPLESWAQDEFDGAFASTDEEDVVSVYTDIINWAQPNRQFTDAAKADFARAADPWLVAYARVKTCVVVTLEQPAPSAKNKIKLPDVCLAFNVRCINTFEMLRELGVSFSYSRITAAI